jgi:CRP-like cAMP-binding protein
METSRLRAFALFSGVADDDIAALADAASERIVSAGETIVRDGDFGYTVFLIEQGDVDVIKSGEHLTTLHAGDVFGEIAVERSGRRTADVVAATDAQLIVVLNRDLWRVERRLPDIEASLRATAEERALGQQVVGAEEIAPAE